MDWVTEPHQLDPDVGAAADRIAGMLPALSDSSDRVLRASEIIPNTFEKLVARLSSGERRELFGEMRP